MLKMKDFDMNKHGFSKLVDFVKAIPYFEVNLDDKPKIRKRSRSIQGNKTTRLQRSGAESIVRAAVSMIPRTDWYKLGEVGAKVRKLDQTFKPARYGASKLIDIIEDMPDYEIRWNQGTPEIRPFSLGANSPDSQNGYSAE